MRDAVQGVLEDMLHDVGLSWLPLKSEVLARVVLATAKGVAMDMAIEDEPATEWLHELVQTLRQWVGILPS